MNVTRTNGAMIKPLTEADRYNNSPDMTNPAQPRTFHPGESEPT